MVVLPSAALRRGGGRKEGNGNDSVAFALFLSTTVITQLLPSSLPATLPEALRKEEQSRKRVYRMVLLKAEC